MNDDRPGPALRGVVRAYLDHLTVERGLAANTLTSYRRDLDRYAAALGAESVADLDAVTAGDVARYLARLRDGDGDHPPLAAASAARAISAVRGLHRFAHREGWVRADVARDVPPPVPPRRLPRALDVAQVARLLDTAGAAGGARGRRDRALLEFLYGTGARVSEAVAADVDDLAEVDGQAMVTLRGKGGRTRLVPMGGYARDAVREWLANGRPELAAAARSVGPALFLNARGGRLSRQSAWLVLRSAARRAGLPVAGDPVAGGPEAGAGVHGVSPHTLRHSYATHLLDGGADVRVVQELLGHSSVTTTQVYTLVTVEKLREVFATSHPRAR